METVKVTAIYAQAATNKAERDAALTPRPRRRFIPLVKPEIEVPRSPPPIDPRLRHRELTPFSGVDVDAFEPSPSPILVSPVGSLASDTLVENIPRWTTTG